MQLKLKLTDQMDKEQSPFEIWLSQNDSDEEKAVIINGLRVMVTQFEGYPRSFEVHGKSWESKLLSCADSSLKATIV